MKRWPLYALGMGMVVLAVVGCGKGASSDQPDSKSDSTAVESKTVKPVIYQLLVRLFSNANSTRKPWGTLQENGVGKFNGITDKALSELQSLGVTHVWYTGVIEHATATAFPEAGLEADDADVVKGRLGSPYAIKDYYDVAPALADDPKARMAEFEALIQRTHDAGLKALIDFVPNHVARSYHSDAKPAGVADLGEGDDLTKAFAPNNNFYYLPGKSLVVPEYDPIPKELAPGEDKKFKETPAKVTGNNVFSEKPSVNDWFETVKLNYGVDMQAEGQPKHFDPIPSTWLKMRDILLYWAGKGVDGFRCDVAEMVPVEFWEWAIKSVKEKYPKLIFIAEIYTPSMYKDYVTKGGFDYLYDKVGLYDKVRPLMEGKADATVAGIEEALQQAEGIDGNMLRFLENHDEQRIASKDFAGDALAGVPGMAVTALIGTGPVMVYFGQEVGEEGKGAEGFGGEDGRTTIFDYWGVPAHQAWLNGGAFDGRGLSVEQNELREYYRSLLNIANSDRALVEGERFEAAVSGGEKVYAFVRCVESQGVLVVANFDRDSAATVQVTIPEGAWKKMSGEKSRNPRATDVLRAPGGVDQAGKLDGVEVMRDKPIEVVMGANSARVISLGKGE
ncbi:MAG: alpha-amylase family protein [Bacteroidia bacterium]